MVATQTGTKRGSKAGSKAAATKAGTAPKAPKAKRTMTDEHKQALADGRSHAKTVKRYLEALGTNTKKRGRKVSPEQLAERLTKAEEDLKSASPLDKLKLTQFVKDTRAKLAALQTPEAQVDISVLEKEFIAIAKSYGASQGIDKSTWLACGVDKKVLAEAGV